MTTPEKRLEVATLLAIGSDPGVWVQVNQVGSGHPGLIGALLRTALQPWGPLAQEAAQRVLERNRISWGLGKGSPDLILVVDSIKGGFIELKSERGSLSEDQRRWHEAARRRGMFVEVVREPDEARDAVRRLRER
jgi:hypothetical protein